MRKYLVGQNVAHVDMDTGEIICETHGRTMIADDQPSEKVISQYDLDPNCENPYFDILFSKAE